MTTTHRLPAADFDELAAGCGGPSAIRVLAGGQLSTRLLRVRALLDLVQDDPGPDAAAARAGWRVLSELGRERAAEVLLHPPVGAWLARCLARRLAAGPGDRPDDTLGHLAGIAATAAIRAGRDVELPVPVRASLVHLPLLGAFPVPAPDGPAALTAAAGTVTVRSAAGVTRFRLDGPGWLPLRRIRVPAAGGLEVYLDDLDPYRDLPGLELAGRLDAPAVKRWRRVLGAAWWMLARHHPGPAAGLAAGLRSVVPLRDTRADQGVSATSVECFGSAAMSRPAAPDVLALGLLHEFQHSKLGALLDLLPLYDRDRRLLLYAPWRDDPRPLGGLLQGAYAYVGVTAFWRVQRELRTGRAARFAEFEFARWREQSSRAVDVLAGSGALTAAGERFVAGMAAELAGCRAEPVPAVAATAAEEANRDHWVTWRARNLTPDRHRVLAAVAAWRAGRPWPGAGPASRPAAAGTFAPAPNARLTLLHVRMREPDRFTRLRGDAAALIADLPHATPADLAYADGDFTAAAAGYARALAADPGSAHAWSGLVLAAGRGKPGDLPPELLRALSDELARTGGPQPDPVALVAWASG
jgi:HEXXH motif-containing protein